MKRTCSRILHLGVRRPVAAFDGQPQLAATTRAPSGRRTKDSAGAPHSRVGGLLVLLALLVLLLASPDPAIAQTTSPALQAYDQRIGEALPGDLALTEQDGVVRPIRSYFGQRPLVVLFGYHQCAQLCSVVSDAAIESLRQVKPGPGTDFEFLYVSIDPQETPAEAAEARTRDLRRFDQPGAAPHWHYLTGSEHDVRRLADAAGFHYQALPEPRQFSHPSGFLVATPDGVISRYFLGVDFAPRDIALGLRRASEGKTGESVFNLVLTCVRGGQITGRYGPVIWRVLQVSVLATVLALGWGIVHLLRQERRSAGHPAPKTP
ncbi:SCO family protein [Opitutaceae bacterium EW11]|nr:SCO family protein [Opitutaceae bacterium EW11]